MSSTETIKKLENFLHLAINPENDDIDITALDGFCTTIQLEANAAFAATKALLPKIQSTNTTESLNALSVLEECMAKCGPKFQTEVGKFRFLNGLIELISKKHRGSTTPKIVRDKILDLLLIWTVQYSHESKIKEAYETLRKQGEVHEQPQNFISHSRPSTTTSCGIAIPQNHVHQYPKPAEDEVSRRLKKLLQSKDPLDVKAANLIIQNMVKEEEKNIQMKSLRLLELKKVGENVSVLEEMLDHYNEGVTTDDELSTIKDLYRACEKLHPTVLRLAQETQENEENLGDILDASDRLTQVFQRYKDVIENESTIATRKTQENVHLPPPNSTTHSLFGDLIENSPSFTSTSATTNILSPSNVLQFDDLASDLKTTETTNNLDSMEELSRVFADMNKEKSSVVASTNILQPQQLQTVPLQPEKINTSLSLNMNDKYKVNFDENWLDETSNKSPTKTIKSKSNSIIPSATAAAGSSSTKSIADIDFLVEGMLHSGLNKTTAVINNVETENAVTQEKDEDEKILDCQPSSSNNDETDNINNVIPNIAPTLNAFGDDQQKPVTKEVIKSLADIEIDLEKITPSKEPPRIIMNDPHGLKVVLNFAEDHPRPDVSVIVVSVVNQDTQSISSFHFDASITSCKLRMLKPSGDNLPGVKPFRPPTEDITQVLLYGNPKRIKDVNMVCILSYCVGDDPDPIRESIEVKNLPYLLQDE